MTNDKLLKLQMEMKEYCRETGNYSYYDLAAYAYRVYHEWIAVLEDKQLRRSLSYYLKSAKKESGQKYTTPLHVAYSNYLDAVMEYKGIKGEIDSE